jgi:hypothetical protein
VSLLLFYNVAATGYIRYEHTQTLSNGNDPGLQFAADCLQQALITSRKADVILVYTPFTLVIDLVLLARSFKLTDTKYECGTRG